MCIAKLVIKEGNPDLIHNIEQHKDVNKKSRTLGAHLNYN